MRKLFAVAALCAASFGFTCSAFEDSNKPPVKYRFSEAQVKAIQDAGPGAKVTGWTDSTLWVQVDGGTPLDESRPCPPFTDC